MSIALNNFDFFIGNWKVAHRQLQQRLANCSEWHDFAGSCAMNTMLGGLGNVDDNVLFHPQGEYRALTVRSFDAENNSWAIWWLDSRNPSKIDTPVLGRFDGGIGKFYAQDHFAGQAIQVRFLWSMEHADQPHWEQAFSLDQGASWETNWTMDFTRM